MTQPSPTIDRRTFLRTTAGAVTATSLAGCASLSALGDDDLVLSPPENHGRVDAADVPHPIYGERLPEASVRDPLADETVSTVQFQGERHVMATFIYTSCTTVCPGLTASLRHVQADATARGYADEMAFLAFTFDPEHDTAAVLREYGEQRGVDFDVGNWHFLRPESPAAATTVVTDAFGVAFERGDASEMGHDDRGETGDGEMGDESDDGGNGRHFAHTELVLLANEAGVVERAYNAGAPAPNTVVQDARDLIEGW